MTGFARRTSSATALRICSHSVTALPEERLLILADSGPVRQLVTTARDGGFRWIDIVAPDRPTLQGLVDELRLPEAVAEDCLDLHQLPKVERHGDAVFILLRMHV